MVQIVIGGNSSCVRKQALRDLKYVSKDLLLEVRREKMSMTQAADIEEHLDSHKLQAVKTPTTKEEKSKASSKRCLYCGGSYPHTNKPCPAKNKISANCGKINHFASQSRSHHTRENRQIGKTREYLRTVKTNDDNALAATAVVQNIAKRSTTNKNTRKRQFLSMDNG